MSVIAYEYREFEGVANSLKEMPSLKQTVMNNAYVKKYNSRPMPESFKYSFEDAIDRLLWYMYIANRVAYGVQYQENPEIFTPDETAEKYTAEQSAEMFSSFMYNIYTNSGNVFLSDDWVGLGEDVQKFLKKEFNMDFEAGGTLPTPFGQAGLVGETGAMNEMELFAMGGDLPDGVHQFFQQTNNPAFPTPHGYAKGGQLDSVAKAIFEPNQKRGKIETQFGDKTLQGLTAMIENNSYEPMEIARAIYFPNANAKTEKIETNFGLKSIVGLRAMIEDARNVMAKGGEIDEYYSKMIDKLGKEGAFERVLKDSQFSQRKGQTDYQHNRLNKSAIISSGKVFVYDNKPKSDGSLKYSNKKTFTSPKELAEYLDENEIFAKGGRLKSALMRDRKYFNKDESWERQYSKNKPKRKGYKKKGGTVKKGSNKRGSIMQIAKDIRKDGEAWKDALKRAGEIMRNK